MNPIDLALSFLAAWLVTYAVHSTILLGGVWVLARRVRVPLSLEETLWKTALLGGLVTAAWQASGVGHEPFGGSIALPWMASTPAPASWSDPSGAADEPAFLASAASAPETRYRDAVRLGAQRIRAERNTPRTLSDWPWLGLLCGAWAAGASLAVGRLLASRLRVGKRLQGRREIRDGILPEILLRLRRRGRIERPVRLTVSPLVAGPLAFGKDEICLPERAVTDLTSEQQESALAHELAHLVRRDPSWRLVSALVEGVFFFQPMNRLARRRIQESAEYLCDDWAVQHTGRGLTLARCLAEVAGWIVSERRPDLAPAMTEGGSPLVRRVERLLDGRRRRGLPTVVRATAAVALVAGVASVAPGVVANGKSPEEREADRIARAIDRLEDRGAFEAPAPVARPAAVLLHEPEREVRVVQRGRRPVVILEPRVVVSEVRVHPRFVTEPIREIPRVVVRKRVDPKIEIEVRRELEQEIRLLERQVRVQVRPRVEILLRRLDAFRNAAEKESRRRAAAADLLEALERREAHEKLQRIHWSWS